MVSTVLPTDFEGYGLGFERASREHSQSKSFGGRIATRNNGRPKVFRLNLVCDEVLVITNNHMKT